MMELTKTTLDDLHTLFVFQSNKAGIWMAAFTAENPSDKEFYINKWTKIVENPDIKMQTMRVNNNIVGSFVHFDFRGETNVSYWIDQQHWGKGFATEGLNAFIKGIVKRPLFARIAFDNFASQKVVEKCGFIKIGTDRGFANARQKEIEEFIYKLN